MKLNVKGVKAITIDLQKRIRKELRSPEIREGLGEILIARIKEQSLGAPSKSTLKNRRYLEQYNNPDPAYDRNKIKAIFTGKLLEDLASNVKFTFKSKEGSYIFEQSNKRHPKYQGKTKKVGSRSPYRAIQQGLEDLGYNYIDVDEKTLEKMSDFIKEQLLNKLS